MSPGQTIIKKHHLWQPPLLKKVKISSLQGYKTNYGAGVELIKPRKNMLEKRYSQVLL